MNRYVYDVYDNKTDMPIIIGGSIDECASALGIKPESFRDYIKKHRDKRRTVIKVVAERCGGYAARLRKARYHRGVSQAELAKMTGVSIASIRAYECGKRLPAIDTAVKIARALKVSIKFFAGGIKNEQKD